MRSLQSRKRIRRVSGLASFGVHNVYEVDLSKELELKLDDLRRSRPAALWEKVKDDL